MNTTDTMFSATEDDYITTIDGKTYDLMQVQRVTWKGAKNVVAFHNADKWVLHSKDGIKTEVKPQDLDYNAHYLLTEMVYPS